MELYTATAYDTSRRLTRAYSTSFSKSITLFDEPLQPHIYAVYGLVRIADEIVDTYDGKNKAELLDELEEETYIAINRGYSPNPIVHAFALTARQYDIDRAIILGEADDLHPSHADRGNAEDCAFSPCVTGLNRCRR